MFTLIKSLLMFMIWLLVGLVAIIMAVLLFDRFWLSRVSSPTHAEQTAALPVLNEKTTNGWVQIPVGDFRFRANVANLDKKDAEPVILLHGFPETSDMWDPLVKNLAEHGYRVVAFDMRGYSPGARPKKVDDYQMQNMVGDVYAVADAVGFKHFHLVGHDWGAAVGWALVINDSSRVASFSSLTVPHLNAFRKALSNDPDQQQRSRYAKLFQMRFIPETLLLFNDAMLMRQTVYNKMTPQQTDFYVHVFLEPGAMTAALNWYRANSFSGEATLGSASVPTLYLWGNRDVALGRTAAQATKDYVTGPYKFVEMDCSHWMIEEKPDQVISEVLAHIQKYQIK